VLFVLAGPIVNKPVADPNQLNEVLVGLVFAIDSKSLCCYYLSPPIVM
jgi:hypothetical protein